MKQLWYGENFKLGVLGGGQLGRMLIQEALNFDVQIHCLDPDSEAPCRSIATSFTQGSLLDYAQVLAFGAEMDTITVEIEHVNIEALMELEQRGIPVYPQPHILKLIQDKGLQKQFYQENFIPTAPFCLIDSASALPSAALKLPFVQKMRKGGYDGKGVQLLRSENDLSQAFDVPAVLEELVDFEKELSVIVARNKKGETAVYPVVECEFNPASNLVEFLFSPADISEEVSLEACNIATTIIKKLDMVGLLAVEFFLTKSGELLVNEIAPRPHNSGHHTIECNVCSQFEQHLRSILNLPLGDTRMIQAGVMLNIVGSGSFVGSPIYKGLEGLLAESGVKPHIYGKKTTKANRKMGHITVSKPLISEAQELGRKIQGILQVEA